MKLAEHLNSFKSVWAVAALAAGAGPLGFWTAELEPPWPPSVGKVATLFCAIALIVVFTVRPARGRHQNERRRRAGLVLLGLGVLGITGYLWAYSRYVVVDSVETGAGDRTIRLVVGTQLRPGLAEEAQGTTNLEMLRDRLYEPEQVWTSASVQNTRLGLAALFIAGFVLLTGGSALLAPPSMPRNTPDSDEGPADQR